MTTKATQTVVTSPVCNSTISLSLRGLHLIILTVQKAYASASSTLSWWQRESAPSPCGFYCPWSWANSRSMWNGLQLKWGNRGLDLMIFRSLPVPSFLSFSHCAAHSLILSSVPRHVGGLSPCSPAPVPVRGSASWESRPRMDLCFEGGAMSCVYSL